MSCAQDFHIRLDTTTGFLTIESPDAQKVYAHGLSIEQAGKWLVTWAMDCLKETSK